ncbi:MAG TPA: tetratricopeptide repeat protein [Pyrinomonadaceae bacterium]|nr:tetratricopeptide repeat protein [Pyrinomonadaceae bacterium]
MPQENTKGVGRFSHYLCAIACLVALSGYQSVAAQVRNNLIERLESVATLIRDDRLAEAERQLDSILKSNANQPDALNLLGAVRAKQKRFDEAEKLFSRAINANAALVSARMNLVQLYLIQSKPQIAISELNQVLRLQPDHTEAFNRLSRLLLSEKRFDEFISLMEQSKTTHAISFSLLLSLGDAYLEKKDAVKAAAAFRLALEQQSDDADALLGLAQAAQLKGDASSASSYLDRAKGSVFKSADTLHRFALVSWEAGRFEQANAALTEAVKLKPDDPAFHVALGTTWLKKPDLVEAERAFRHALQLQPENPEAQMYLGYTLLLQARYPEARELLEKSLAKQPRVSQTFFYLGLIFQEQGDDLAAVQHFKKALDLLPSFTEVHVALGRSYLTLKDYPRAQTELELAVKLNPNDIQANYQLAVLYARLKDPQRAQQQMQIVERLKEAATTSRKSNPQ